MTETNSEIGLSKIELHFEVVLEYTINGPSADFLINIHAAQTHHQFVIEEQLTVDPTVSYTLDADTAGNRWLRLRAYSGTQQVSYRATVSLTHEVSVPDSLSEMPIGELPFAVLPYLRPSRYCQSDRLMRLATNEFSAYAPGYARVHAIQEWVRKRVAFQPQTSNVSTSAMDTLIEQVGVCRDYAHLMIALCRAMNIPARCATGIDYGADPALGPIDFHAYVEVFLSGRWYIFDPSGLAIPMGFLRIGTGRDAADVAFATIFGNVQTGMPRLHAEARQDFKENIILPFHTPNLLSTAAL